MRELKLVGLSADGSQVVLVDDQGTEFSTPADEKLRAALRGDRARLGQLEIEMDSVLRPRDIQARIRAGDSPETVASLAQVPVEKVMPYCVPVLAERQHIAELARRSHVRRRGAESIQRPLVDVVTERLRARGVDPNMTGWDAWRRDDGRWEVQASYLSGERQRTALFIFDVVGRYSLPDDDEAKWLAGEPQTTSHGPQPRDSGRPGERRLSAVSDADLLALQGEDVTDDLTAVARAVQETSEEPDHGDAPDTGERDGSATDDASMLDEDEDSEPARTSFLDEAFDRHTVLPSADADAAGEKTEPPTEPTPTRKRGRGRRTAMPSWDEIMFGKDDAPDPHS